MIVQKYGGSSVSNVEKILNIANNIIQKKELEPDIIVVVSAMGNNTDYLLNLSKEISPTPSERELDVLLSTGEQQTTALLSMALNALGCKAISLIGAQVKIETTGCHTRSSISNIQSDSIKKYIDKGNVVIVAGFQGVNEQGDITTLGRGGSDTTAVALAATFKCPCEIYTDVKGIYSIDPKLYTGSKILKKLSYELALEMARLGAKVIDKRALSLGRKFNVPIYIGDSLKNKIGSKIGAFKMENFKITSLVIDIEQIEVTINNIPNKQEDISKLFHILGKYDLDIGIIENTVQKNKLKVSLICNKEHHLLLKNIIGEVKNEIDQLINLEIGNVARLSIITSGRMNQAEVSSKIFSFINEAKLKCEKFYTSELSLSFLFKSIDMKDLVNRLAINYNL